ncbi:MAG: hypothetical protein HQL14_02630 [Candidatus Omnitrophica bacterium]|nr:hypothetical protein [Candidatus Omnitrophota bacterium]
MLIPILIVLIIGLYYVAKLIVPEMRKSLPIEQSSLGTEKLEIMLVDKNRIIHHLQAELKMLHVQSQNYDKIIKLLEDEIQRLREQNRMFRSELGLPPSQPKENSIT